MDSAKQSPVTIPKCATLFCRIIKITVPKVITHKRSYPKELPPDILVAQFPGSIKPTVTRSPGPIYFKILNFFS